MKKAFCSDFRIPNSTQSLFWDSVLLFSRFYAVQNAFFRVPYCFMWKMSSSERRRQSKHQLRIPEELREPLAEHCPDVRIKQLRYHGYPVPGVL